MPEINQGSELPLLIQAAKGAGEIARAFFEKGAEAWDKPGDQGPVTEADLAVNTYLHDTLMAARPSYGWLSEETTDSDARLSKDTLFIIDPIDGTRSFISGAQTWSHSIAIVHKGQVTAGVVYLPMRDMLFSAAKGSGAHLGDTPIHAKDPADLDAADILATKPNMDPSHWHHGKVPGFSRHHRPSLAYRLCLIAQGRFDGMMTLRPSWEWDIAAGALIAAEAGATLSDKTGAPLRFNNADPRLDGVLCAPYKLHQALQSRLASA